MRSQIDKGTSICNFLGKRVDIGNLQILKSMQNILHPGLSHEESNKITVVLVKFDLVILDDYFALLVHAWVERFLHKELVT